jgi:hypothetical protein
MFNGGGSGTTRCCDYHELQGGKLLQIVSFADFSSKIDRSLRRRACGVINYFSRIRFCVDYLIVVPFPRAF